jgi:hypothetical protein
VSVSFVGAATVGGARCRRREMETELPVVQRENVIGPSEFEELIREARLLVGSGVEKRPIDLMKLRRSPVVDPLHVLDLGLVVGVREGGASNMS